MWYFEPWRFLLALKALFSIRELAKMTGTEPRKMARILNTAEIRYVMSGTKRLVPLSELHSRASGVIDSARLVRVLRKAEET